MMPPIERGQVIAGYVTTGGKHHYLIDGVIVDFYKDKKWIVMIRVTTELKLVKYISKPIDKVIFK